MDPRRRQPSASMSVKSEDVRTHTRRASHSVTPLEEDEGKRSSRGRNPLPPTSGPLFPPLPPKQPKSARSSLSRLAPPSPSLRENTAANPSESALAVDIELPAEDSTITAATDEPAEDTKSRASTPDETKPEAPEGSTMSLTPPPPTSEDVLGDAEADVAEPADTAEVPTDGDDTLSGVSVVQDAEAPQQEVEEVRDASEGQEEVRRSRPTRGRASAVKQERLEEEQLQGENEETPRRNGHVANGSHRILSPPSIERLDSAGRARKRRGEGQLLLDDHLLPAEMRRTGSLSGKRGKDKDGEDDEMEDEQEAEEGDGGDGEDEDEITRCICKTEDNGLFMMQCDKCNVWQHGPCMGLWDEDEVPDEYFCEECRPDLHGPLKKWIRSKGRNAAHIGWPRPQELQRLHHPSDKHPPSQSKRWANPLNWDPPLTKPPVRSHHRKQAASPVESTDGKRPGRDRTSSHAVARKSSGREVPLVAPVPEPPVKQEVRNRPDSTKRRVSMAQSPSPSHSPPPHGMPGKRRSTMNSRDAAYEEQVKAALEASRREEAGEGPDEEVVDAEPVEEVAEDIGPVRKGKRKRDDEDADSEHGAATAPNSSKPKHPNQYTYRPKSVTSVQQAAAVPAAPAPLRRAAQASTPIPSLPPPAQHEHGTRRAGAIANGTIPPPPNTISVHNLHWYLPDHLTQYADILPTPDPIALEARSSRVLSYLPRNHFVNQKYGPFTEDRDEKGKLILPEDPGSRDVTGNAHTRLEPPARVRYPAKRITSAEIRKRVRMMLEYVSKVQSEETKRKERADMIGIDIRSLGKAIRVSKDGEEIPDEDDLPVSISRPADETEDADDHGEMEPRRPRQPAVGYGHGVSSAVLMDEIMRDLIAFQESFATGGGFGGLGGLGVSPMLPSLSQFGSAPPTPVMPSTASVPSAPSLPSVPSALSVASLGNADDANADITDLVPQDETTEVSESAGLPQELAPLDSDANVDMSADVSPNEMVMSPAQISLEAVAMTQMVPADIPDHPVTPAPQSPEMEVENAEDVKMSPEVPVMSEMKETDPVQPAESIKPTELLEISESTEPMDDSMDLDDLPIPSEMTGTDEPVTGLLGMPSMPASGNTNGTSPLLDTGADPSLGTSLPSAETAVQAGQTDTDFAEAASEAVGGNDDATKNASSENPSSELETPVDVYREGKVDEVLIAEEDVPRPEQRMSGIGVGSG